nr:hypothetical protein [Tanacetum cinerariifolium]
MLLTQKAGRTLEKTLERSQILEERLLNVDAQRLLHEEAVEYEKYLLNTRHEKICDLSNVFSNVLPAFCVKSMAMITTSIPCLANIKDKTIYGNRL